MCSGGYCCAIGVQHKEVANLGAVLVTLFASYSDDGVSAVIGVQHRGGKSGCKLVTEFDSYSDDGVSAVIGVQHTEVPNLGASW